MNFSAEVRRHLRGESFSSGLVIPLGGPESEIRERRATLTELAGGKSIIHVGFADHAELLERKLRRDQWLHAHLCRSASRCLGVDVNEAAVTHIRDVLGYRDVFHHDLTDSTRLAAITEGSWDWLFLPEVLEHIDDPVSFLRRVRELYGAHVSRLLVTVPNALELTNLRFLWRRQECVNTDHRYWFTPYTLAKVCTRAGWQIDEFFYCQSHLPESRGERALLRTFPQLRETVVMLLRP